MLSQLKFMNIGDNEIYIVADVEYSVKTMNSSVSVASLHNGPVCLQSSGRLGWIEAAHSRLCRGTWSWGV